MRTIGMAALAAWTALCSAQTYYQFGIDQDNLAGAPDFSFLNHPLHPADRVFVRDGHFYRVGPDLRPNTADDERVRFFGANLAFGANFPTASDAPRIAKRLRRLGINLVRLHHMDSSPDSNPQNAGSILTTGPYPTLNPVAMARLRTFLSALEAEGIYCDLNLHVGYTFRPEIDEVPALPDGTPIPTQSKPLHIFWPRMVALQTDFTRKLIDALQLKDDPVLAVVEIDNETSLLQAWQSNKLDSYLKGDYFAELHRQWNTYLESRYKTTDALRAAWGRGEPPGPELLNGKWTLEVHVPSQATLAILSDGTAVVNVTQGGAAVIAKSVGFTVAGGSAYVAELEMRADLPAGVSRPVYWDVKQDTSPWRTEGSKTVAVSNEWKKFIMPFTAAFAMQGIGRFGLSVEQLDAPIYIRNTSLHAAGRRGLAPHETIENGNIALVSETEAAKDTRANDYLLFLAGEDRAYLNQMLAAVREKTDTLVPVAGTQMGFGGLLNYDSHVDLDYQDNHFYVDHYGFPHTPWDGRDWTIHDVSAIGTDLTSFTNVAAARQAGRPYTVSEYNEPWPNTHGAEIDPALAVFGAFQDWDGIMHFAYSHGRNWDDNVPNGFNLNGDWTKFPNVGQAAWLFRSGAIAAANTPVEIPAPLSLRLREGREKRSGSIAAFLNSVLGYDPATAFRHAVQLVKDSNAGVPELRALNGPYNSDTGQLTYDPEHKFFLVQADEANGVLGFLNGTRLSAGAIDVELAPGARGFAALLVTPLDGKAIGLSHHLLLSNPGYTLRTQPGSDPARQQKLVNYPEQSDLWTLEADVAYKPSGNLNGGIAPVWMERVEAFVTLRTAAASMTVYPLDGTGTRLPALGATDVQAIDGGFRIHLQADGQAFSPWYEILCRDRNRRRSR